MSATNGLQLVDFQNTLYNWIKKEIEGYDPEVTILWRNQSEPLPPRPCVTLKITDGPKRGGLQDNLMYAGGNRYVIGGQREITVSLQVFGSTKVNKPMAYQLAFDLNSSLSKLTVLDILRGGKVSVLRNGDPTNITALEETEFEERAQFDVVFGVAQNVTDDPGIIETADITENVSGP